MSELTFKRFGTQIDCSRNAVMNVDAIKRWIDMVAAMGHNTLAHMKFIFRWKNYAEINDCGHIERIEELEMEQLDPRTPLDPTYGVKKYQTYWNRNSRYYSDVVSACVTDKPEN